MRITKKRRVIMELPNGRVVSYPLSDVFEAAGLTETLAMRLEPSDIVRRGFYHKTVLEWCQFYKMTPHVIRKGTTQQQKGEIE